MVEGASRYSGTGTTGPSGGTRRDSFAPLPEGRGEAWVRHFNSPPAPQFMRTVGLVLEEVRTDYARLSLPYRVELNQPAGLVHGGAMATMMDAVVVPAIGAVYETPPMMVTIDMQIRYLSAAREVDLVCEGWVVRRGRSIAFCEAEVASPSGEVFATAWLTYRVRPAS
ncbi:MAG: PaaI family thioesterase [Microthrixaceae bacterium]